MTPPLYGILPFAALLVCVALCPLWIPHWWESNGNKLLLGSALSLPVLLAYGVNRPEALIHIFTDYVSFIILIAGLFVITGGIRLTGDLRATPAVNTGFLALGAVLASLIGTTGASMLLVRPLLQTNRERTKTTHTVVFFVFIVSNIGGMLTPLGDPPLFLGYLAGVPFTWTLRLFPVWATMTGGLLATFFVFDSVQFSREPLSAIRRDRAETEPLRLEGRMNGIWLVGVAVAVAVLRTPWREGVIAVLVAVSFWTTSSQVRRKNGFSAAPIVEVAVLFAAIFVTMTPAVELLHARGGELGLSRPWHFFWATGLLSSFLDNAPTYLTFLAVAQGLHLPADVVGVPHSLLAAVSVGAVAMGANSYIGNAPNFMVKAIAEEAGVRMPTFIGYMAYSGAILLPLFCIVTLVFFR
jgi:Na+/H+ antiporter NhaD/arsenite permease-like protein